VLKALVRALIYLLTARIIGKRVYPVKKGIKELWSLLLSD
jgi:hypothetical protein